MELQDDLDSLLKGAAERFGNIPSFEQTGNTPLSEQTGNTTLSEHRGNIPLSEQTGNTPLSKQTGNTPLSEQTVSSIIDDRLTESKNRLRSAFRKEIILIVITLLFIIGILAETFSHQHHYKPTTLMAFRGAIIGGILYLAGSIMLFLRLAQVARLQKDTGIREYLQGICTKTERALLTYICISTIASTAALGTIFVGDEKHSWYWVSGMTVIMGGVMYYLNSWYTKKRFGKRLNEMKMLLEEFK